LIGLFTGTFDPVHLGHMALVRAALREGGLDEMWLLVNADPAHKIDVMAYEHRLAMAELAVRDEPGVRVVDYRESHTYAGFRAFMAAWPREQFVFVVGMDVMAGIDRWDDIKSVVLDTAFLVAQRPSVGDEVAALRQRLGRVGDLLDAREFEFDAYNMASSRRIRELLRAGEQSEWLDARVAEYISHHSLYL